MKKPQRLQRFSVSEVYPNSRQIEFQGELSDIEQFSEFGTLRELNSGKTFWLSVFAYYNFDEVVEYAKSLAGESGKKIAFEVRWVHAITGKGGWAAGPFDTMWDAYSERDRWDRIAKENRCYGTIYYVEEVESND